MSLALDFYAGTHPDHQGRHRTDILAMSNEDLEASHDVIQWLFPADISSSYMPYAPLLTPGDIEDFQHNDQFRERMVDSLDRMLAFYGFLRVTSPDGKVVISRNTEGFEEHSRHWLSANNHNYMRLTRIIRCLALVGLRPYADALCRCLWQVAQDFPDRVERITIHYWTEATSPQCEP